MQFIRFSGNSPSPFHDPSHENFETLAKSYFIPKIKDNGKPSFYKSKVTKNKYITAGFISIRDKEPKTQLLIFIDNLVFIESKVKISFQKSSKLYSCIANFHFCADFSDDKKLDLFLYYLKLNLQKKDNKDYLIQYKKQEIREILKEVNKSCDNNEIKLQEWVINILFS
jgi:hypothetical protein